MSFIDRLRDRLFGFRRPAGDLSLAGSGIAPVGSSSGENKPVNESNPGMVDKDNQSEKNSGFPERVMFVCSGNICRSPYGEARFTQMCAKKHPDTRIISSGILRMAGHKASPEMITVASERGLDLSQHRSAGLSKLLVDSSDVIFVMAQKHRMEILRIAPNSDQKIVLLAHWLKTPKYEIEDPIGQSMDVYRAVADDIDEALMNWWEEKAK